MDCGVFINYCNYLPHLQYRLKVKTFMSPILRLQHWHTFLLIVVFGLLSNFSIENNPELTKILSFTGMLFFLLWQLIVGHELYQYVPKRISLRYTMFVINGFVCIIVLAVLVFYYDGFVELEGIAALGIFYFIYAIIQFMSFPAKTLKSIELNKEAPLSDYFMDFMLFLFLPFGIWFLQPRFNKIAEANHT